MAVPSNDMVINVIYEAIVHTEQKYGRKQAKTALDSFIYKGTIDYCDVESRKKEPIEPLKDGKNPKYERAWKAIVDACSEMYAKKLMLTTYIDGVTPPLQEKLQDTMSVESITQIVSGLIRGETVPGYSDNNEMAEEARKNGADSLSHYVAEIVSDSVFEDFMRRRDKEKKAQTPKKPEVSNVKIFKDNIDKARTFIMDGVNHFRREGIGHIGKTLFAASTIGNYRESQQDAVILLTHPSNPEFKLLLVADGMGGHEGGEIASSMAVEMTRKWFEGLDKPEYYFENPGELQEEWIGEIKKISGEIENTLTRDKKRGGTTYCGAIVGNNKTIIANVGDSRAYAYTNDGGLEQVTKDDSKAQILFKNRVITEKDDMRFYDESNTITKCLGFPGANCTPTFSILNNDFYKALLLVTDGVSDCLSDDKIKAICRNTNLTKLAESLVYAAKNTISRRNRKPSDKVKYSTVIQAGKDNATAAVVINPKKNIEKDKEPEM